MNFRCKFRHHRRSRFTIRVQNFGDLATFYVGTCEAPRFDSNSNRPFRFDSIRQWKGRIGRVCPLLVVVRRLKPLTALSGTVCRLASSMSDHTPVLFNVFQPSLSIFSIIYLQDTCRMAAPEFRYGLEVQQTSVQKQTHLLCSFPFQFSLETINCLCRHRIIISRAANEKIMHLMIQAPK